MRGRFIVAAMVLASSAPVSAALDLNRASVSHLPDGLTVIMLEDHTFPLVSVQMLYKSGSAAEITGKTGLAHFMEHLAFRGSQNFPKARATDLIYDTGGEWHGYTAFDQTTYFSTISKDQLDLLLKIEADRMARVIIDPAAMDAEKGAVITELHSYDNDPAAVLGDAVGRTAIQAHPYGSPMAGYVSDVERLTVDDAKAYYSSHYAPGNAVLAVVGDFDPVATQALLTRDFADVPARSMARPHFTAEPPQRGERRVQLHGPIDRQYFTLAYHAPAASSPDFPAFLVLQEILAGGSGLNLRQSDWVPSAATKGTLLFGVTDDIASWLPPTRDSFLFTINGSIGSKANSAALERTVESRIASLRDRPVTAARLAAAKAAVIRAIAEDVQTTEDAAHQLAFFEGVGALDQLLQMPKLVSEVSSTDMQRIAKTYLVRDQLTVGWMLPGKSVSGIAAGAARNAADRLGTQSPTSPAGQPLLRRLPGGLPAIVQASPLSDTVTLELLISGPSANGSHPDDLVGLDSIVRTGRPADLSAMMHDALAAAGKAAAPDTPDADPAERLQQLLVAQTVPRTRATPAPIAVVVSGNVDPRRAFDLLTQQLGHVTAAKLPDFATNPAGPKLIQEKIDKPLAQGGLGYVVQGPTPGTRDALVWRMLLYVLTHDYSGRLGNSAIRDKGLVYHIYSLQHTDGHHTWATISTGVDPEKADAMEAELRAQIARLTTELPTQSEVDAARNHLLGRDLTAAQSNEELASKLTRNSVETNGLRSHEELLTLLMTITPADLAAIVQEFAKGTVIRVDVEKP